MVVIAKYLNGNGKINLTDHTIFNKKNKKWNSTQTIILLNAAFKVSDLEGKGKQKEAGKIFLQGWNEATNDFEKFMTAYYVARHQENVSDKLKWFETALRLALKINNDLVKGAFASLYANIAKCYEDLNDPGNAKKNYELANSVIDKPSDIGPFLSRYKGRSSCGRFSDCRVQFQL